MAPGGGEGSSKELGGIQPKEAVSAIRGNGHGSNTAARSVSGGNQGGRLGGLNGVRWGTGSEFRRRGGVSGAMTCGRITGSFWDSKGEKLLGDEEKISGKKRQKGGNGWVLKDVEH